MSPVIPATPTPAPSAHAFCSSIRRMPHIYRSHPTMLHHGLSPVLRRLCAIHAGQTVFWYTFSKSFLNNEIFQSFIQTSFES